MIYKEVFYTRFLNGYYELIEYEVDKNGYFVFSEKNLKKYFDYLVYMEKKNHYEKLTGVQYEKYLTGSFDDFDELVNSAYSDYFLEINFDDIFLPIINNLKIIINKKYYQTTIYDTKIYYLNPKKIEVLIY